MGDISNVDAMNLELPEPDHIMDHRIPFMTKKFIRFFLSSYTNRWMFLVLWKNKMILARSLQDQ